MPLQPTRPLASRARRRRAAGYTAVEVIMAMTVMIIGAAAVMSMQKTTIQGNFDARRTDVASNIARSWVDRLQRDAMQWTCPGPACQNSSNIGRALLLGGNGANVTGQWFLPTVYLGTTTPESMSPGFDILGRDLPSTQLAPAATSGWPGAQFCVNVRLTWLTQPNLVGTATTPPDGGLIRADVRVLWPRGIAGGTPAAGFCDATTAALADPETIAPTGQRPFFHALYTTTTLHVTPAQ